MIPKGLFNQTLTLYTLTETDDGMGGKTQSYSAGGSFRGRISPLKSEERMSQDKTTTIATHKIFCDNMTVTTEDRILYGSIYLKITGIVNPSEMNHHLEIWVTEID